MDFNISIMPVTSISDKSFVQFNEEVLTCKGDTRQSALPAYETFAIKYQFKVEDELLPTNTVFKAAICSSECDTLLNEDITAIPLCTRWTFVNDEGEQLAASDFPITVNTYIPIGDQPQLPEGEYTASQFIDIINELYDVNLPGLDYVSCCEEVEISGISVTYGGDSYDIQLGEFYYSGYVNYPATDMTGIVSLDECFRYCILDETDTVLNCSNLFVRIANDCKTTVFRYWNDDNAYGFNYVAYEDGGDMFISENMIRLFVNFYNPGTPIEENIIRRPDGSYQRVSTVFEQQWRAQAAPLSTDQLFQLTAMLKHDNLYVINEEVGFDDLMTQIGEPEPDYQDGVRTRTTMVYFNIMQHSPNNVNKNCGGECGIELIDDCEGGGGVINPCPDRFGVEFQIAADATLTTYQNDGLIGLSRLDVYREGIFQYLVSGDYSFNQLTGEVTFNPQLTGSERVAIWEA